MPLSWITGEDDGAAMTHRLGGEAISGLILSCCRREGAGMMGERRVEQGRLVLRSRRDGRGSITGRRTSVAMIFSGKFTIVLMTCVLSWSTAARAQPLKTYTDPQFGWSISYPSDWVQQGPELPTFRARNRYASCDVTSGPAPNMSANQLADFYLNHLVIAGRISGVEVEILERRERILATGFSAVDAWVVRHGQGKDRAMYVVADGLGYNLFCETGEEDWAVLEGTFEAIIRSFSVRMAR